MLWIRTAIAATSLTLACGSAMGSPENPYNSDESEAQHQQPSQPQAQQQDRSPSQNEAGPQNPQDQNQNRYRSNENQSGNDAAVESFEWVTGRSHLGVVVMQMTRDLRSYFGAPVDRGVLVAKVMPRSAAARAGIRTGDVILDVANRPVTSADDVIAVLSARTDPRLDLTIIRDGQQRTLTAHLPMQPQQDRNANPML